MRGVPVFVDMYTLVTVTSDTPQENQKTSVVTLCMREV